MDRKRFVQELEEELLKDRHEHQEIVRRFLSKPRTTEEHVAWLKQRCWNEVWVMKASSEMLARYWDQLDRDLVEAIAKRIWDEARHYDLLARILEELTGKKVQPSELKPLPEWAAFQGRRLEYAREGFIYFLAGVQFLGEGTAKFTAEVLAKEGPEIVRKAYAQIEREETFHSNIGKTALLRYAKTPEVQRRIKDTINELRKLHLEARRRIYPEQSQAVPQTDNVKGNP